MSDSMMIQSLISISNACIPITLVTIWWAMRRSGREMSPPLALPIVLGLGLFWAALWVLLPALQPLRLAAPPGGQVIAIAISVLLFVGLLLVPSMRAFLRQADLRQLLILGPWRIFYGLILLALGVLGGLPPAFFWSAAFGDIAVGLWSLVLLRRPTVSPGTLVVWNGVGLADLLHVLVLGALSLRGFYLANPDLPLLGLLPLVGVPAFIAVHSMTLWALYARRSVLVPSST
jgi:hypothetical protein